MRNVIETKSLRRSEDFGWSANWNYLVDDYVSLSKVHRHPSNIFFSPYNPRYLLSPLPLRFCRSPAHESRNSFSTSALMIYAFGRVLCISAQCARLQVFYVLTPPSENERSAEWSRKRETLAEREGQGRSVREEKRTAIKRHIGSAAAPRCRR